MLKAQLGRQLFCLSQEGLFLGFRKTGSQIYPTSKGLSARGEERPWVAEGVRVQQEQKRANRTGLEAEHAGFLSPIHLRNPLLARKFPYLALQTLQTNPGGHAFLPVKEQP